MLPLLGALLLLLLALSLPPARSTTLAAVPHTAPPKILCSSLQGPWCRPINGRSPPRSAAGLRAALPTPGGRPDARASPPTSSSYLETRLQELISNPQLRDMVHKLLSIQQQRQQRSEASSEEESVVAIRRGAFRVRAQTKENRVLVEPTGWIQRPSPLWSQVGFLGELDARGLVLSGTLRHPATTKRLRECSRLRLTRRHFRVLSERSFRNRPHVWLHSFSSYQRKARNPPGCPVWTALDETGALRHSATSLTGEWIGTYSCGGSRTTTRWSLIKTSKETSSVEKSLKARDEFVGRFRFLAESFPGSETTRSGCKCRAARDWWFLHRRVPKGRCARPLMFGKEPWCVIEKNTCVRPPKGGDWDVCRESPRTAREEHGRPGAVSRTLALGQRVVARWKGMQVYYPGRIDKDHGNATYAVAYDDGDYELVVPRELIRDARAYSTAGAQPGRLLELEQRPVLGEASAGGNQEDEEGSQESDAGKSNVVSFRVDPDGNVEMVVGEV